jgi:hypothetical protein
MGLYLGIFAASVVSMEVVPTSRAECRRSNGLPRPHSFPPRRLFCSGHLRNCEPGCTSMARRTDRPLSDAEFLEAFRTLVKRLDSHISSVDRGERHVRDDLAAVLRILLTRGKGENAIGRFLSRHRMSAEATVSLPAFDGASVWLSLGSLPWDATGGTKTRVVSIPTGLNESTALNLPYSRHTGFRGDR